MKDYYQILEISPLAEEKEIKAAYRRLAKLYHPDVAGSHPEKKSIMYEIQEAYHTLIDAKKRREYDKKRAETPKAGPGWQKPDRSAGMERKETEGSGTAGWESPSSREEQFKRFFGFHPGKGMETYEDRRKKSGKGDGPMKPEERFASFFKHIN